MERRLQVRSYIRRQNGSHKVVIWSLSDCPFCVATLKIFAKCGLSSTEEIALYRLDFHQDGTLIEKELVVMTGMDSILTVFVNGHCIGDYDRVRKAYASGELQRLLDQRPPRPHSPMKIPRNEHSRCPSLRKVETCEQMGFSGDLPHKNFTWGKSHVQSPPLGRQNMFRSMLGPPSVIVIGSQNNMEDQKNHQIKHRNIDLERICKNPKPSANLNLGAGNLSLGTSLLFKRNEGQHREDQALSTSPFQDRESCMDKGRGPRVVSDLSYRLATMNKEFTKGEKRDSFAPG